LKGLYHICLSFQNDKIQNGFQRIIIKRGAPLVDGLARFPKDLFKSIKTPLTA
jgi:hypothetical protein